MREQAKQSFSLKIQDPDPTFFVIDDETEDWEESFQTKDGRNISKIDTMEISIEEAANCESVNGSFVLEIQGICNETIQVST